MSVNNQFQESLVMFRDYVGISDYIDYDAWMKLPEEYQAAALYVSFYPQISLAWFKAKEAYPFNHDEDDGVSTVMQYLQKQVPLLREDSKRYTQAYIYRVAFNCLDCCTYATVKRRFEYANLQSNEIAVDGDVLDLFDLTASRDATAEELVDEIFTDAGRDEFWDIIESIDTQNNNSTATNIVNALLQGKEYKRGKAETNAKILEQIQVLLQAWYDAKQQ